VSQNWAHSAKGSHPYRKACRSRGIKVVAPPLDSPCDRMVTYPGDTKILTKSSKGRSRPTLNKYVNYNNKTIKQNYIFYCQYLIFMATCFGQNWPSAASIKHKNNEDNCKQYVLDRGVRTQCRGRFSYMFMFLCTHIIICERVSWKS